MVAHSSCVVANRVDGNVDLPFHTPHRGSHFTDRLRFRGLRLHAHHTLRKARLGLKRPLWVLLLKRRISIFALEVCAGSYWVVCWSIGADRTLVFHFAFQRGPSAEGVHGALEADRALAVSAPRCVHVARRLVGRFPVNFFSFHPHPHVRWLRVRWKLALREIRRRPFERWSGFYNSFVQIIGKLRLLDQRLRWSLLRSCGVPVSANAISGFNWRKTGLFQRSRFRTWNIFNFGHSRELALPRKWTWVLISLLVVIIDSTSGRHKILRLFGFPCLPDNFPPLCLRILSFLELLVEGLSYGHWIRVVDALVSCLDDFGRFLNWLLLLQEFANLFDYVVLYRTSDLFIKSLGIWPSNVPLRFSSDRIFRHDRFRLLDFNCGLAFRFDRNFRRWHLVLRFTSWLEVPLL